MAIADPTSGAFVAYPLIRLPDSKLVNPFNSVIYDTDGSAQAAVGEFIAKPFANASVYQSALAANGGDVLKLFGLGGRVPASVVVVNGVPVVNNNGDPFLGGILDGEIFGVNKKIVLAGALLFFFLSGKK